MPHSLDQPVECLRFFPVKISQKLFFISADLHSTSRNKLGWGFVCSWSKNHAVSASLSCFADFPAARSIHFYAVKFLGFKPQVVRNSEVSQFSEKLRTQNQNDLDPKTKMNLLVKIFFCAMIELDASNAVEIGFWDTENALFVSTLSEYTSVSQGQKY